MRALRLLTILVVAMACTGEGDIPPCTDGLALRQVTVIDGLGGPPLGDQSVLICDGRITEVAPTATARVPRRAKKVELPGRFVLPGFIDVHAHVAILPLDADGRVRPEMSRADSESTLRTLLAFGVTTVRNPAAPTGDGVRLREAVASGEILGPRIKTAGEALNPTQSPLGPFVAVRDEAAVVAEVERQAKLGVDYIKVYAALPPELVRIAVEEAHRHGLQIIGHLQRTTWTEGARSGIDSITHGAPWSTQYLPEPVRAGYRGSVRDRLKWLEQVDLDGSAIAEMITTLVDNRVSIDPTLLAYRTKFFGDDPRHTRHPELDLAPPTVREAWQRVTFTDNWSTEDYGRGHEVWPRVLELTKKLYDGGVLLTAGSDLPNPWVIPGVSFHEELQLLAEAGIPPLEVLKIATYNGAASLGIADEVGSIAAGKRADLVVLASDPTRRLANTRAIELVLLNGRALNPSALLAVASSGGAR